MKRPHLALVGLTLAAGILLWIALSPRPRSSGQEPPARPGDASAVRDVASARPEPLSIPGVPAPDERSPLADRLNANDGNVRADLAVVSGLLEAYQLSHRLLPTGGNADITAALSGRNRRGLAFLPPDHPAIVEGELRDRWGTPFYFHAQSSTQVEVRSAGPDQRLFTEDDVTP